MPSNNDYVLLDEGVLDSIIKLWKYAANFKSNYNTTNAKIKADRLTHTSSIARAAKNLTMSFPTVCSDAVSGSTAAIINKAIELKNVTMIQMVAAAAHFTGFNGIDVVNKIHSNIGVNYNVDDYIDSILSFKDAFEKTKFESYIPLTGTYRILAEQLKQEFLESCNHVYPVSSFNEIAISNYYVVDSYGSPKVMYEAINPYSYEYEDPKNRLTALKYNQDEEQWNDDYDLRKKQFEHQKRQDTIKNKATTTSNNTARANYNLSKSKFNYQKKRDEAEDKYRAGRDKVSDDRDIRRDAQADVNNQFSQQHYNIQQNLSALDVKKANELIPTMIVLRYQVTDPSKNPSDANIYISDEFIAGVKSRLIPCASSDIIGRIVSFHNNKGDMKGLIKATTGETKFAKDFLASVQDAKIQARKDSKLSKNNAIWRSLQARSNRSKLNRLTRMQNGSAAITTLVITQQEVDMVKDEYNIDMNNPKVAIDFMDAYNLMSLVIVDEPLEIAHFIYDGDAYFEDLSFSALQRENDKSYKQVIDLLNKSR